MTEWTAKLRENQPNGKVHSYTSDGPDGLLGAAEALAHFSSLKERPVITLDSNLELTLHTSATVPGQVCTVKAILHYLRHQQDVLAGLDDSEVWRLTTLAEELGV